MGLHETIRNFINMSGQKRKAMRGLQASVKARSDLGEVQRLIDQMDQSGVDDLIEIHTKSPNGIPLDVQAMFTTGLADWIEKRALALQEPTKGQASALASSIRDAIEKREQREKAKAAENATKSPKRSTKNSPQKARATAAAEASPAAAENTATAAAAPQVYTAAAVGSPLLKGQASAPDQPQPLVASVLGNAESQVSVQASQASKPELASRAGASASSVAGLYGQAASSETSAAKVDASLLQNQASTSNQPKPSMVAPAFGNSHSQASVQVSQGSKPEQASSVGASAPSVAGLYGQSNNNNIGQSSTAQAGKTGQSTANTAQGGSKQRAVASTVGNTPSQASVQVANQGGSGSGLAYQTEAPISTIAGLHGQPNAEQSAQMQSKQKKSSYADRRNVVICYDAVCYEYCYHWTIYSNRNDYCYRSRTAATY